MIYLVHTHQLKIAMSAEKAEHKKRNDSQNPKFIFKLKIKPNVQFDIMFR